MTVKPLTKAEAFEAMLAATNAEAYIEAYQAHYLACNELERRLIVIEHTNGPAAAEERVRIERELAIDPREPDPDKDGIFRDHNCWKCKSGEYPCANGNPRRCEYPRARND